MKKRFGVAAVAVAAGCAVIFAGCNGCGANGKANEAAFSSNWYADTNFRYIQPTFTQGNTEYKDSEEVTYTVKHDREGAANSTYSVEYGDGTYKTSFYATTFDKTLIDEEFRGEYADNLTVYYYETALSFPSVTFKMKNDESKVAEFKDGENTVTKCYFTNVDSHLRPLYSEITTQCHLPKEFQTNVLEETYEYVNQTVKTSYKYDGSAAKSVISEGDETTVKTADKLNDTDNSLIDVCGLNIAVRAMQLSTSFTQVISVYSPAGKMQNYAFTGSSAALGDDERKTVEGILAADDLKLYTPAEDKTLSTVCVTATLNADMKGVSQQYWFAAVDNAKNNTGRATMVKMSVPLTFGLGTLNYSLKSIDSTVY